MTIGYAITILIVFFGSINLLRMALFLIGSDWYGYLHHKTKKEHKKPYLPSFSVVIPVHNEEGSIIRCVSSVIENTYPKYKLQVIVVDDGSTDTTPMLLKEYKKKSHAINLTIIRQENAGKAHAVNRGMRDIARGSLVMCLDSDSYIDKDAIMNAAQYFRDKKVMALAANVKIIDRPGFLNTIQKFEYLICYQMKRAQSLFNIEYIIGGIGSTFRRSMLKKVGYYDTNTITEDIDITMKILQYGNKMIRVLYGSNVIAHTESVMDIGGLIRQRYRWKYGRCQAFLKNRKMFFNGDNRFTKSLTYFYLPFAIFCDFAFFFEPIMVGYILFLLFTYHDFVTILSAFLVISSYIILNIMAEDTLTLKEKILLSLVGPSMYMYFYVLSFVEYIALIKALIFLPRLQTSIDAGICGWQHVKRPGIAVD